MALALPEGRCISFDSYIKPQLASCCFGFLKVVYLLIPTSNHNCSPLSFIHCRLYIFWFLHQTTTSWWVLSFVLCCISFDSYIKPQLSLSHGWCMQGCISFDSYIKPQPVPSHAAVVSVVYLLIPTSNHNNHNAVNNSSIVVYLLIPTSNHNRLLTYVWFLQLYIFWFLHQTTTPN